MALVSLQVDVHCVTTSHGEPVYRVFVDDNLLTERSWIWPAYEVYIEENIEVQLDEGRHQVKVEGLNRTSADIIAKNLRVDGKLVEGNDLSFVL
jgi:hypothetical protein